MKRLLTTHAPAATNLIRLTVGGIFFAGGLQKFLYPAAPGSGRFEKTGLPDPEFLGSFVGGFEMVCGILILLGLATRLAAVPLVAIMSIAPFTTKIPILLGHAFMGFEPRALDRYGFLSMIHEARTDFAMLFACLFLLIVGAGKWSLDAGLSAATKTNLKP